MSDDAVPHEISRSEKAYLKFLDQYVGPVSGVAILLLCLVVYRLPMQLSEQVADHLAFNEDEQALINPAAAALLDKQHFSVATRDKILQSADWLGLAIGLGSWGARVAGTLQQIQGEIAHGQFRQNAAQQAANGTANGTGTSVRLGGNPLAGFAQYNPN